MLDSTAAVAAECQAESAPPHAIAPPRAGTGAGRLQRRERESDKLLPNGTSFVPLKSAVHRYKQKNGPVPAEKDRAHWEETTLRTKLD